MSEEIKTDEKVCKCKEHDTFKSFALLTAGAFTGCLLALCVYTTFAKPIVLPAAPAPAPIQYRMPLSNEYGRPDFQHHRKMEKRDYKRSDYRQKAEKSKTPNQDQQQKSTK